MSNEKWTPEIRTYLPEAAALRDEVARWRQEAAEQAEIAHKLRVALEECLTWAENQGWHEPGVLGARAALAGVKVEEPEVAEDDRCTKLETYIESVHDDLREIIDDCKYVDLQIIQRIEAVLNGPCPL